MFKIIVGSEQEKQELLQASSLLHSKRHINLRHPGLNKLAHFYLNPDCIIVQGEMETNTYVQLYVIPLTNLV